jgi:hypothetical protein
VTPSRGRRASGADESPSIGRGIIPSAGVQIVRVAVSAPHNHFSARPDCCVTVPSGRRVGGVVRGGPAVRAGIVSATAVENIRVISSTPHKHFTARPDCCVIISAIGRVSGAGGCPTIRARIVSPSSV